MKTVDALYTRTDYARLPEGFPAQLIGGELVKEATPTYGHQGLAFAVGRALTNIVPERLVFPLPVDVPIDEHNVFQSDVAVFADAPPNDETGTVVPRVVFEVRSPSTGRRDRAVKCPKYLEAGVEEVWLVDAYAKTIDVVTRDRARTFRENESATSDAIPGFALVPGNLFGR